jgi:hypothetical protein
MDGAEDPAPEMGGERRIGCHTTQSTQTHLRTDTSHYLSLSLLHPHTQKWEGGPNPNPNPTTGGLTLT